MICGECGDFFEYEDESQLCLHCWNMAHNMPCDCRDEECIARDNIQKNVSTTMITAFQPEPEVFVFAASIRTVTHERRS